MKIEKASAEIIKFGDISLIEPIARVCTQSTKKEDDFIYKLIRRGHESPMEHVSATVRFICDRGTSHELVRHRLASFTQESTRFCKYDEITFIRPPVWADESDVFQLWKIAMENAEKAYLELIARRVKPENARAVLPTSTKTELIVTANMREWRHIFKARCGYENHPQMQELMLYLLKEFHLRAVSIFEDIAINWGIYEKKKAQA
jgi:thymidylate synthase (FAD)